MTLLPFWACGLALASVAVAHWLLTRRMMAVSGRFSAIVDRARHGAPVDEPAMTEAELLAALADVTRDEFGADAIESAPPAVATAASPAILAPQPPLTHALFFVSVALGGLLSFLLAGGGAASLALRGETFTATFGSGPLAWSVLAFGGVLVGFGTRMAGGCTSGHGLCGVSRFQPGSLLATAAFFGAGIVVAFAIGALT